VARVSNFRFQVILSGEKIEQGRILTLLFHGRLDFVHASVDFVTAYVDVRNAFADFESLLIETLIVSG
jgi:hypothetical protein